MPISTWVKLVSGCCLLAFATIASRPYWTNTRDAKVDVDSEGLKSLRVNGTEYLADGNFRINSVQMRRRDGTLAAADLTNTRSVTRNIVRSCFSWGTVVVEYAPHASGLDVILTTTNDTADTISSISYELFQLKLPAKPDEYDGVTPMLAHNIEEPSVIPLTSRRARLVLVNEDVERPLLIGFPWALNKPENTVFPLRINTGRDPAYPDSLADIERPIPPHASDTYRLSLRFTRRETPLKTTASDVYAHFSSAYPYRLNWLDRRPVGLLFIARPAPGWSSNPRGWLLDPKIDVTTPAGIKAFHDRLLRWADNSVAVLKSMDSQGMITWDIEGQEFPQPVSYIGDPRLATTLAPEMNGIIDEYFNRFKSAGLRVGVCIRPSTFVITSDHKGHQQDARDPAKTLMDKMLYARQRWGATLFYIDSNGTPARPMNVAVFQKVAAAFPDVLLIPEHKSVAYYSIAAPYAELRRGVVSSPAEAKSIYPKAFTFIYTADGQIDSRFQDLRSAVHNGDTVMFRGWFNEPANQKLKELFKN